MAHRISQKDLIQKLKELYREHERRIVIRRPNYIPTLLTAGEKDTELTQMISLTTSLIYDLDSGINTLIELNKPLSIYTYSRANIDERFLGFNPTNNNNGIRVRETYSLVESNTWVHVVRLCTDNSMHLHDLVRGFIKPAYPNPPYRRVELNIKAELVEEI